MLVGGSPPNFASMRTGPTYSSLPFREAESPSGSRWRRRSTYRSTCSSCASWACLGNEELAIGAIASGGVRVLDRDLIRVARVSDAEVERVTATENAELERQERLYRGDRRFPDLHEKTVILIDDGLATGSTMRAGVEALREERPARIVVAVPVASPETCDAFRDIADDIICAETPEPFRAVGLWYDDFSQTTDEEVHDLLDRARGSAHATL